MKVSVHIEVQGEVSPKSDKLLKKAFARALQELGALKDVEPCTEIHDDWRQDSTGEDSTAVRTGGTIPARVEDATRYAKVITESVVAVESVGDPAP